MKRSHLFWSFIVFLVVSGVLFSWIVPLNPDDLSVWFQSLGWLAPILFVLILTFAIVVSQIPNIPIALAGGALFGVIEASVLLLISGVLGSSFCFFVGRYFRGFVLSKIGSDYSFLVSASSRKIGWIVFISRLFPFFPFDIISYASGLTSLKFHHFFVATLFGMIPMILVFAYTGEMLVQGAIWPYVGLALVLTLTIVVPPLFGKRLKKWLE